MKQKQEMKQLNNRNEISQTFNDILIDDYGRFAIQKALLQSYHLQHSKRQERTYRRRTSLPLNWIRGIVFSFTCNNP